MMSNKTARVLSVVVVTAVLVHCAGWQNGIGAERANATAASPAGPVQALTLVTDDKLPANVAGMREMILAAVQSGQIEELQAAVDQNELPPEVGAPAGVSPIEHLRKLSADGAGREALAILGNILHTDPALLPIGRDAENNGVYVWPGIAEADLQKFTPAQEVELYRLMPVADAKAMIAAKTWIWWRIAIGADGTWLTFMKYE